MKNKVKYTNTGNRVDLKTFTVTELTLLNNVFHVKSWSLAPIKKD